MKYINLVEMLILKIPEIKNLYEKEINWWGDEEPGAHNIFGDIVNPYFLCLLKTEETQEHLKRVFDFLEEMAKSEDKLVQEVLNCTVLERLGDDKEILKRASKYMGQKTKNMSGNMEKGLRRKT